MRAPPGGFLGTGDSGEKGSLPGRWRQGMDDYVNTAMAGGLRLTDTVRWARAREAHLFSQLMMSPVAKIPTLAEFFPTFMEKHTVANQYTKATRVSYEKLTHAYLLPSLGNLRLDQITDARVQELKVLLVGEGARRLPGTTQTRAGAKSGAPSTRNGRRGLSATSINLVLTILSVILGRAVKWGLISRMPCVITKIRGAKSESAWVPMDQYDMLVATARECGPRYLAVVLLGGDAGLRVGEIAGLDWSHVNFDASTIRVAQAYVLSELVAPKGKDERLVPMTSTLRAALQSLWMEASVPGYLGLGLEGPVITTHAGGRCTSPQIRALFKSVAAKAGIQLNGSFHALRHTMATATLDASKELKAVSNLLGHKNVSTTNDYVHVLPESAIAAINSLEKSRKRRSKRKKSETPRKKKGADSAASKGTNNDDPDSGK